MKISKLLIILIISLMFAVALYADINKVRSIDEFVALFSDNSSAEMLDNRYKEEEIQRHNNRVIAENNTDYSEQRRAVHEPSNRPHTAYSGNMPAAVPRDVNSFAGVNTNRPDTASKPDFSPYMRDLNRRIRMNWNPPESIGDRGVVASFSIAKDGSLLSCDVKNSSGSESVDKSAIKAIKDSAPFRPLPSNFNRQKVNILFTFYKNSTGASMY